MDLGIHTVHTLSAYIYIYIYSSMYVGLAFDVLKTPRFEDSGSNSLWQVGRAFNRCSKDHISLRPKPQGLRVLHSDSKARDKAGFSV